MTTQGHELRLEKLAKTYGDHQVIHDLDLAIPAGSFCTLLGASGSGKTTLLKMIAGYESPTRGRILLDGQDIAPVPVRRRNIGMVFQNYALFPHMTVAQNVAFGLEMRKIGRAEIRQRVTTILALVGLADFAARMPRALSGGQQQRVALARALVIEPTLLLMDEPLGALDKVLRQELQQELSHLHKRLDVTIILVTHEEEEALQLSDLLVVMERGRIAQHGAPRLLYNQPETRFVASFLGECNFVEQEGKLLALRPERLRIGDAARAMPCQFDAIVTETRFLGTVLRLSVARGDGLFTALVPTDAEGRDPQPGQTVLADYAPADTVALSG